MRQYRGNNLIKSQKVPKAIRLPCGSWNVKIMVNGEWISVTAPAKRAAENKAAAIKSGAKTIHKKAQITLGDAIDRYID